jgi:hypothetical protein
MPPPSKNIRAERIKGTLDASEFDISGSLSITGSFTGSFIGDGSQLTGIISSKWSGSNPITRDSDVEITGSLNVTGNISGSFIGDGSQLTGISYERLSDFQSPYHYSGNATLGTSTSSIGWIINRIDFTTPGSPITLQGTGSWDNRTSLIYS